MQEGKSFLFPNEEPCFFFSFSFLFFKNGAGDENEMPLLCRLPSKTFPYFLIPFI